MPVEGANEACVIQFLSESTKRTIVECCLEFASYVKTAFKIVPKRVKEFCDTC